MSSHSLKSTLAMRLSASVSFTYYKSSTSACLHSPLSCIPGGQGIVASLFTVHAWRFYFALSLLTVFRLRLQRLHGCFVGTIPSVRPSSSLSPIQIRCRPAVEVRTYRYLQHRSTSVKTTYPVLLKTHAITFKYDHLTRWTPPTLNRTTPCQKLK